jgi:hypothetical protein
MLMFSMVIVEISAESVKACSFLHQRKSIPHTEIIYSTSFRYNRFANSFFPQLLADLELGSDVWSQAVVLGKLGTSILIYMENTRVSFLDDLIKTCSWNIWYFIPEYPTKTKNSNFVEDHPRNISAKFGSNRPSGCGEEAWNVKSLQTTDNRRRTPSDGNSSPGPLENTRVSFLDDLIKTCSWNIWYFIPYTLMIKFTTCFPMVGGCL